VSEVSSLAAGDIGVGVKLKETRTGDTLAAKGEKVAIRPIKYPPTGDGHGHTAKKKGDEGQDSLRFPEAFAAKIRLSNYFRPQL